MNRFILSMCAAAILTGCASSPKSAPEPEQVFATPAERAYTLGMEHRRIQDCRAELGEGRVAQHRDSVKLLLTSYPANIRDSLKSDFAKGYATGPALFHRIPCTEIAPLLDEQVACNAAETRRNLKAAAKLK
jgi:hypothetical protein